MTEPGETARMYIQCAGSVSIDGRPAGRLDPAAYEILAGYVPALASWVHQGVCLGGWTKSVPPLPAVGALFVCRFYPTVSLQLTGAKHLARI